MAEAEEQGLISGSIDDFLLALADGVHKTQRQLSQMSIAMQPGQPAITYQLPKVDFEFKVAFELAALDPSDAAGTTALRLRPQGTGPAQGASAEASSTIKGSFVAVPAQGGKPPPVVDIRLEKDSARTLRIQVSASTAAGEMLEGVAVEFNVERELSRQLNLAAGLEHELSEKTDVWHGLVHTDSNGRAETVLEVDPEEPANTLVAVLVDTLSESQIVTFKIE